MDPTILQLSQEDTNFLSDQVEANQQDLVQQQLKKEEEERALQEAQAQQEAQEDAQTPGAGPLQALGDAAYGVAVEREKSATTTESRNALNNAALRFGESVTTFPERITDAAKGVDIGDPDYKPDWNPVGDFVEFRGGYAPTKTWWGDIAEEMAYYGSYGLAVTAGSAAAGVSLGAAGVSMGSAALAALVSKQHDDHNLSGKIVEHVPEMGIVLGPLATRDEDHPLLKKLKNVVEEMGMAGVFDRVIGKMFGERGVDKALNREANVAEQVLEKGQQELDDAMQYVRDINLDTPQLGGDVVDVDVIADAKPLQYGTDKALPPQLAFRGHKNKPIADPWQGSPNSTAPAGDIYEQLNKIDDPNVPGGAAGSTDSPLTPAQAERMANENGIPSEVLQEKAAELLGDARYQRMVQDLKSKGRSFRQVFEPAYKRMQEVMGRNLDDMSAEEFWAPIDAYNKDVANLGDETYELWSMENVVAADLVNSALFKQLRDLSIGSRELMAQGVDIADVDGPLKSIRDRLIIGLSEVKKRRYLWGIQGQQLQLAPEQIAERFAEIHKQTKGSIDTALEFMGKTENQEILEAIIEAFSGADNIHNWTDLDAFMRRRLHGFSNKNQTLKELGGVFVNSVLSGLKTSQRALVGTGEIMGLQSLGKGIGGALLGDLDTARAGMASFKSHMEIIPEAWTVFKTRLNSYWTGDFADMRNRFSEYNTTDQMWAMQEQWIEQRGTVGDKFSYSIGWIARGLNDNRLLSYSPRLLSSVDDTYKFIMARARAKERSVRKVLEMKRGGDLLEARPEDYKYFENNFYKELLDADGNIDLTKDAFLEGMYKEATLTSELTGFAANLDKLIGQYPMLRPFYLFARTGINGLDMNVKNMPLIGAFRKRTLDVLTANEDNLLEKVGKYGINSMEDLRNERALLAGRQAIGLGVTISGTQMYLNGNLTGDGPMDEQLKQAWLAAGWKPRSIKIAGAWVSYDALGEPFSMILANIANVGDNLDLMGEEWAEDHWKKMAAALAAGPLKKSYFSGLDSLFQLVNMKPEGSARAIGSIMNNIVPLSSARNEFGRIINPYMRELNADIFESIRNRNLASEYLATDPLPLKYDMLTGKPLNNWNFLQRAWNAVTPFQINFDDNSPGRRLLLESNYPIRESVYSANGYDLSDAAEVRSMLQQAMGNAKINFGGRTFENPQAALDFLASRKDVQDSLQDMRRELEAGNRFMDPSKSFKHVDLIETVMAQAKSKAWAQISQDPAVQLLIEEQDEKDLKQVQSRANQTIENSAPALILTNK
jgi:hypothetical protein